MGTTRGARKPGRPAARRKIAAAKSAHLQRARRIARANGLAHVYTGNVHDTDGGTTSCSGCGAPLIERDWHRVLRYELDAAGRCRGCGAALAGRYVAEPPALSMRVVPVRVRMR